MITEKAIFDWFGQMRFVFAPAISISKIDLFFARIGLVECNVSVIVRMYNKRWATAKQVNEQ